MIVCAEGPIAKGVGAFQRLKGRLVSTGVPIKNDLFRFATLRGPTLLEGDRLNLSFVRHPNLARSAVKRCPSGGPSKISTAEAWTKYLATFAPIPSLAQLKSNMPDLYDSAIALGRFDLDRLPRTSTPDPLTKADRTTLFETLFQQLITDGSPSLRESVSSMLVADHALRHRAALLKLGVRRVTDIKVLVPQLVLDCRHAYRRCGGTLRGVVNLGIAEFRRVEQEVCCYVPGEVSHIDNVMAHEYRERSTRNLVRSEDTLETSRETELETLEDVNTAERRKLSSEIASVLEDEVKKSADLKTGVSAEYMKVKMSLDAHADLATTTSSSFSDKSAREYAEDVTRRALERLVQKTTERRTTKIIKEYEEENKHGFDNRSGDSHVTGVYRWLDIIYTNRLINYGRRLTIGFTIPVPAEFYRRITALRTAAAASSPANAPVASGGSLKSPAELGIKSFADVTRANYSNLGASYGLNLPAPLPASKDVAAAFTPDPAIKHNGPDWTRTGSVPVDTDYLAESVTGSYSFRWRALLGESAHFNFNMGGVTGGHTGLQGKEQTTTGAISGTFSPKIASSVPITYTGDKLFEYTVNISVHCVLDPAKFEAWQKAVYQQLSSAYEHAKSTQAPVTPPAAASSDDERPATNPAFNRAVEQRELKRGAIAMLTKPFCVPMGVRFITDDKTCKTYAIPVTTQTPAFEAYAREAQFFEQAFDWNLMSYLFYPYYWADKCDWGELLSLSDDDPLFQSFLQSGMARVVVPVRPEYVAAVSYYLETGDVSHSTALVPDSADDLYASVIADLSSPPNIVEGEWESRVPTSLALIQARSAYLDEEGLPCCHHVGGTDATHLRASESLLGLLDGRG